MSLPGPRSVPAAIAEGWRIEIPMPYHGGDAPRHLRGLPVGWLNLNQIKGGVRANKDRWWVKKAWREAAYNALMIHRVPRGFDRIYVAVELRFPTRGRRDSDNYALTLKPIYDALSPKKIVGANVELGWGVIPDDNPNHLVRGEPTFGPPLGRTSPVKGMVIITITPLPALEAL